MTLFVIVGVCISVFVLSVAVWHFLEFRRVCRKLKEYKNNLYTQTWYRLSDEAVLDREDMQQSLTEMHEDKIVEL